MEKQEEIYEIKQHVEVLRLRKDVSHDLNILLNEFEYLKRRIEFIELFLDSKYDEENKMVMYH